MRYRCNYHRLVAGIDSYLAGVWPGETEQCETPPTHYVSLRQRLADADVEHLTNLCAQHEAEVRRMDGWSWSRPKEVYA